MEITFLSIGIISLCVTCWALGKMLDRLKKRIDFLEKHLYTPPTGEPKGFYKPVDNDN